MAAVAVALIASLLALTPRPTPVGAQEPAPPVTTETEWLNDCIGRVGSIGQPQTEAQAFAVTAPGTVAPDEEFTIRIAPKEGRLPTRAFNAIVGWVDVYGLNNIRFMYEFPTNAEFIGAEIVEGSGFGYNGTPNVTVDETTHAEPRIIMFTPEVLTDPEPGDDFTAFQLPAVDVTVRATGPIGSNITTRVAGTDEATSGYTFFADNSAAEASVRCWPAGNVAAPIMSQTGISSGSVTEPTTTTLTVDPTLLPAGNSVTMVATVTAPSGVVRFNDGATILGYQEINDQGIASLTAPLNTIGNRSLTARYVGSPGFEASTSDPVAVTVTNPNNRDRVQVAVTSDPARINVASSPTFPRPAAVTVEVSSTDGGPAPSGEVRLYLNDEVVGTQSLDGGSTVFSTEAFIGGNQFRAEYLGDTNYFGATGTVSVPATGANNSYATERPLTGTIDLNGVDGPVPAPASVLSSTFRTEFDGTQVLGGILVFPSATYSIAGGGSVTGVLAQYGDAIGSINNVWDPVGEVWLPNASAELSTSLVFQVASADFANGQGVQNFASTCVVGPFDVDLSGTRTGLNGALTLTPDAPFSVPFANPGTCLNESGNSRSAQVGAAFAGAATSGFSLTLTPPAAGAATEVSAVSVTPAELADVSSFGQPVTLSATLSRVNGANLPISSEGAIEFYVDGQLVGSANTGFAFNVPTKTVSLALPAPGGGASPARPPLPQGEISLEARFVPNESNKLTLAASDFSVPKHYTVLPPITKLTPTVELAVPEVVSVGETVTLGVTLTPPPSEAPGAADLSGVVYIYDDNAPLEEGLIPITAINFAASGIVVSASSDGYYETQTALAPGVYSLRAVFEPDLLSAWGWTSAESAAQPHTVVGEQLQSALSVVSDSTRGTGRIPVGQQGWVEVQLDPQIAATIGPWTPEILAVNPFGSVISGQLDSAGRTTMTVFTNNQTPGLYETTFWFDPAYRTVETGIPASSSNQLFLPTELTFQYEVVDPVADGPLPTVTEVMSVNPAPVPVGATWSQVNGYVTYNAAGSVQYTARNVATAAVTNLGTANVNTGTGVSTGRGLARLSNPAVTAGLPAGTYEVRGSFTPTNPALWQPSSSEPFLVTIADGAIATTTTLTASPAERSAPGQPVVLEALVEPTLFTAGTVEFFDGDTSLGVAPTGNGVATMVAFGLADGEHSLTAEFTPTNPGVVEGSVSEVLEHLVIEPAVETSTVLSITPEAESLEGDDVTFTAVVDPGAAPGSVLFEDEHGVLGEVEVEEGEAVLVLSDLEPGVHEIEAAFVSDDETEYSNSVSEPVTHTVIAQSEPEAPTAVTATAGGLMATVTWTPGSTGGQPVESFTVSVSPGDTEVVVSGAVTTVDVIGLTEGEDYSFTVVATNSIGSSEPSDPSNTVTVGPPTEEFSDVDVDHAFFAEITWMAEVGLSTGYEDGTYKPSGTLSRQAMSAFLYRLNGSPDGPEPTCTTAPFSDVPVDHAFCGEIAWMEENEISTGYPDGTYRPEDGLSREAMSAFMYRSADNPDGPDPTCSEPPFTDVPTTNAFCGEIAWMASVGISEGYPDGTYQPAATLTRQAMSAFLYRYTLVIQTTIV